MRRLGTLEAEVMRLVWAAGGPVTVRHVLIELRHDRTVAYTTVMTVMDKLHTKRLLDRERVGKAYRYRAHTTREEYNAIVMREALGDGGDPASTLMHLLQRLSPEETRALRDAYESLTGGSGA